MSDVGSQPFENQIRLAAITEVLHPTFALTEQYLSVNTLQTRSGVPDLEDIIIDHENNVAAVYFPVVNEEYYLIVYVNISESPTIHWVEMSPGTTVELIVISDEISLSEILALLPITPTTQWEKGQPRNKSVLHKNNGITWALSSQKTGEVDKKLKSLVNYLLPYQEALIRLATVATTQVSIGYYGYKDQMWGIHLDAEVIQTLAQLHISLDIDLYASGPDLP